MYKSVSFASFGVKSDSKNPEVWRNNIDVPILPQKGGRTQVITLKYRPILVAVLVLVALLLLYTYTSSQQRHYANLYSQSGKVGAVFKHMNQRKLTFYNKTYPLTKPITTAVGASFRVGIITDMDTNSKVPSKENVWKSLMRYGDLSFNNQTNSMTIKWHSDDGNSIKLTSSYAYKGRGMELSELVVFNGRVYTIDDRTGIVYEIHGGKASPWSVLSDGNGREPKGFKGEWMTVKDEKLYIGGLGKEWTTGDGVVLHSNPQWIKAIDKDRSVTDLNWVPNYLSMQKASGYVSPGYIIHESAAWSDIHQAWFFLPRRASHEKYDEDLDEMRATNLLFQCSDDFHDVRVMRIGKVDHPARGFSSFKFVPGTKDQIIVALKTEEVKGQTRSYITAFTLDGVILLADSLISEQYKYEGIEFL